MPPRPADVHAAAIDIADPASETPAVAEIAALPPGGLLLLQLTSSDPHDRPSTARAMPRAATAVTRLARAATNGAKLALDPRDGCWMRRVEDAVRVAIRVNRGNVGVAFHVDHWHKADGDEAMLPDRLKLALPKLLMVTTSSDDQRTAHVLRLLQAMGYTGPVGAAVPH
jgi:sugar phosphate isomerase/epimerase